MTGTNFRPIWMTVAALWFAVAAPVDAGAAEDPAFGDWLTAGGKAIVEIQPCGAKACGKIVWLADPKTADGKPKVDVKNAKSAERGRPICGLPLVGDFSKKAAGDWQDGYIYDPENGKTYTAEMAVQGDGTLKLRGYVGVAAFGKTQVWTRAEGDKGGC